MTLSLPEEAALKKYGTLFRAAGYEIEHFGGKEYTISAVPANIYGIDPKNLFLSAISEIGTAKTVKEEIARIIREVFEEE